MAFSDESVLLAATGSIFMAEAETALPSDGVKTFTVNAETVDTGWRNVGYLSAETLPEISTDGGDATTRAVWQNPQFRTTYDQVTGTIMFNSVQGDAATIAEMFSGKKDEDGGVAFSLEKTELKRALFVLWQDSGTQERSGMYIPNCSVAYSTLPTLDSDNFVEFQMQANILQSSSLPQDANGRATNIKFFDAAAFTATPSEP